MIKAGLKLTKPAVTAVSFAAGNRFIRRQPLSPPVAPLRQFCTNTGPSINPVTVQMLNYALSLARSQKSDDSYAQALLVLEQCLSSQPDDNSKGMVLLAISTLFYERCQFSEAVEKLQKVQEELNLNCIGVRVATTEALVGLHLELGQEGVASALADVCVQLVNTIKLEIGNGYGFDVSEARIKATKGLIELVCSNLKSAETLFDVARDGKSHSGNATLSYGEFLHTQQNFTVAKEFYEKAIKGMLETKEFNDLYQVAACNMVSEEVLLAATCSLGQLEAHMGNFAGAEEILTRALTRAEQQYGSHHPKVGVVLTCIALMFRRKATLERSSSLLIQEGLYRRAIELLKAPPVQIGGMEGKLHRRDILALARGGYAETLCVQQNRKAEGEKMKCWAESAWGNRRLSLVDALDISEPSSKVPVIDTRICRAL